MPDYMTLAYHGNYVSRGPFRTVEYFTYHGQLWLASYKTGHVLPVNPSEGF
jgi:hypothetical protein